MKTAIPLLVALSAFASPCVAPLADLAAQSSAPHLVVVDFVKANPGEKQRLITYYQLNWARARAIVLAQGDIISYRLLVSADSGSRWDVALETTFADSAAYARAEEIFQPVLARLGHALVDGKRRADIATIVESRQLFVNRP